jgi:hypothetical protein
MAGLRAGRRVGVSADLDLEDLRPPEVPLMVIAVAASAGAADTTIAAATATTMVATIPTLARPRLRSAMIKRRTAPPRRDLSMRLVLLNVAGDSRRSPCWPWSAQGPPLIAAAVTGPQLDR